MRIKVKTIIRQPPPLIPPSQQGFGGHSGLWRSGERQGEVKRLRLLRVLTVAWLILVVAGSVSAGEVSSDDRVVEVRVEGCRVVSEEVVKEWLGLRRGMVWSGRRGKRGGESVLQAYQNLGYWNARIDGPIIKRVAGGVSVTYAVDEGEQVVVGAVTFLGTLAVSIEQVASVVETVEGDPLIQANLLADAEALMDFFERQGYPFASIDPEIRIAPGESIVGVAWAIDAGPRVSIDGVRFSGNTSTRDELLFRETGLSVGDLYDQRAVDEATRALRRLPWLVDVTEAAIEKDARSGRYILHYEVVEAKATTIEGGVGLLPAVDGTYDWVGRIQFASDNLAGSGRGAHFLWDRPEPASSDLQIRYSEPWLLGQPLHGQVGVAFERRPGYVEAGLNLGLSYRPVADTEVSVTLERLSVRPDTVARAVAGAAVVDRQGIWSFGGEIDLDRRDSRRLPTRGWSVLASGKWDRVQNADRGENFNRLRYGVGASGYRPTGSHTTLGLRLQAEGLFQKQSPSPNALIRLGGSRTIRGYVEEHFLVEHAVWANLALLRDLGRGSRGYLFGDGGLLRLPDSAGSGWVNALGYGVGLQTRTRTGTIVVEYGLSKEDSPGQGKIHVRLLSAF